MTEHRPAFQTRRSVDVALVGPQECRVASPCCHEPLISICMALVKVGILMQCSDNVASCCEGNLFLGSNHRHCSTQRSP